MHTDIVPRRAPSEAEYQFAPTAPVAEPKADDKTAGSAVACPNDDLLAALPSLANHRILIVDDNPAIHDDFRKVLAGGNRPQPALLQAEAALFGVLEAPVPAADFELDSAHQGQEALEKVKQALAAGRPYAMAFVDVRMPPGWDGIETATRVWEADPQLQVVICTAYSDYSWEEMVRKLGARDNLVLLKKPFDNVEVLQLAYAFTRKWELNCQARLKLSELTQMAALRTRELEVANQELRREMQERIHAEQQFRQAQKMEAIGQLAAGVAHDFNNILTVVHGHASMLSMRLGEEGPHSKSIAEIRRSAERAASLVRQLLTFSRKQILQFRNVQLGEVIQSVSAMLRQLVGEHIVFETDCPPNLPPIYADRGMIEQIVVNLTINARDAMPRGGRLLLGSSLVTLDGVAAKAHPESRPGQFVCLTVADTGCGMDAQALGHLFEPFFTTKEIGKGTGLGLATVYGIVKQHRGWIEVQSQLQLGTTFHIYFPLSQQTVPQPPEAKAGPPDCSGTETILLAEDEPTLREMVAEVLGLLGYRVLVASSGPAALAVWHQQKGEIDMLLTDIVMPGGMMGTDLAVQLRKSNPALKVIFTTGYSPGMTGAHQSLREGVNFLPKPYAPGKLSELVRNCLDR
ncbi:MAG TPA: response regulator [Candidatus Binatia bacterium]|jgi:two-component system NtrC family sensor kinase|nr:response regulator [Candidatus Binatia bacterium]